MSCKPYRGCTNLYPASSRLNSVPPMSSCDFEDDFGAARGRSMVRRAHRAEKWINRRYGDMVCGEFPVSPGPSTLRSPSEFSRDLLARSRSPSPFLETINNMHKDFCDEVKEKMFHRRYQSMYPETYRGSSSVYNASLGRNMMASDSPQYRYYRYNNTYSEPFQPSTFSPSRYMTRTQEIVYVPMQNPAAKPPKCSTRRL